jgi:hypothetical protein
MYNAFRIGVARAAVVAAALASTSCNIIGDAPSALPVGNINVTSHDTVGGKVSAPADGSTVLLVVVHFDAAIPRDQRSVAIHTTTGTFEGKSDITEIAGDADSVIAYLRTGTQVDTAYITATVGTALSRTEVVFRRAYPDSIKLTAPQFTLDTGLTNAVTITANLKRLVGRATAGTSVVFSAVDSLNPSTSIGTFSEAFPSDTAGQVAVKYSSGTYFIGTVKIGAATRGNGKTLTDSVPLSDTFYLHIFASK